MDDMDDMGDEVDLMSQPDIMEGEGMVEEEESAVGENDLSEPTGYKEPAAKVNKFAAGARVGQGTFILEIFFDLI